jgi:hypothetical protein
MGDTTMIVTMTPGSCLGRTCLKWGPDGELTALDLELVLLRLAEVDQDVSALVEGTLGSQTCCASLS